MDLIKRKIYRYGDDAFLGIIVANEVGRHVIVKLSKEFRSNGWRCSEDTGDPDTYKKISKVVPIDANDHFLYISKSNITIGKKKRINCSFYVKIDTLKNE